MLQRTAADLLNLPNSLNGHAIAVSLLTSLALSLVTIGLVAPAIGYYQLFLLIAVGPATFIHHITMFCLLRKHGDEAEKSLVPTFLTRKVNIGFMALFELTWLAGTVVGFWFYSTYHDSTDMVILAGLAVTSNIIALLECLALLALIVFCIRARNERSRAPREMILA